MPSSRRGQSARGRALTASPEAKGSLPRDPLRSAKQGGHLGDALTLSWPGSRPSQAWAGLRLEAAMPRGRRRISKNLKKILDPGNSLGGVWKPHPVSIRSPSAFVSELDLFQSLPAFFLPRIPKEKARGRKQAANGAPGGHQVFGASRASGAQTSVDPSVVSCCLQHRGQLLHSQAKGWQPGADSKWPPPFSPSPP